LPTGQTTGSWGHTKWQELYFQGKVISQAQYNQCQRDIKNAEAEEIVLLAPKPSGK